ncbi:undecaprenyldiphospho-muramoylpentapeptide beta-N-acetylglucosaminyltransferase [candidate division WOR-1 bacterium RIFOXYA2_FULL_36_21]|uniref:UDP-N-acetylglucosamine--N-acetylmuramyl-(pentapeptide) pyrophosphoryl-undecaprenol N-acetylglucosamine transferase n=1 Tax=candidate division WOR-1 bacterium RIFOXYB2_FULL_36_35 TaxID=1802578 RepID=A0A1F4RYA3_UNCSA|nr:MAG: undecaprenyldiphospho-muramoylpentapeptide beta-N-acetylglucosaminyltransferase [candidate division WOR-1 bacterium RIFOXYA2_FULL_36_21]OGC13152.1 MAG: undecaprenyldiphospho-muramoylpentapeptide beta-N-acetylglucosaminyltransferase [candidate division WOR-1 bacterium RIFOXYB2_FULL_36_35]OGC16924.1 MAG: undecaprenyldiphospho-muramoylpentapeptide beta-N-acetylglucosaminyltransferase [candidate division WOR-1 bacterium RIFOXYA12_FULL_36_13]
MKIIIAAGGTGGHIYPGIAIAEELSKRDQKSDPLQSNNILFLTSRDGLGRKIITKEGFPCKTIWARGLKRKISYQSVSAVFIVLIGFFQALYHLIKFKPDIVFLTGGYLSFPVAFAAKVLKIKTILHEQNVLPGFVSRVLSRFVDATILSFEESLKFIFGKVLGNPVRRRIKNIQMEHTNKKKKILIMGGSQGALVLNKTIIKNIDRFKKENVEIIHLVGDRDFTPLIEKQDLTPFPFYHPLPYMYNIEEGLSGCDLVISRAGATAIAEFLILGIPSILIPFPYSAEGHQDLNARIVEEKGAGILIFEKDIGKLFNVIDELIHNEKKLNAMSDNALKFAKKTAAEEIVDLIYEIN